MWRTRSDKEVAQQMLTIYRTLMGDPHLIMIDEPTEGLAPKLVQQVAGLLTEIARRGAPDDLRRADGVRREWLEV